MSETIIFAENKLHFDMTESFNSPDFFRMDRSVITKENLDALYQVTGNHIAESIVYDICYEHQYNEFGFGIIDPEDFGKKYGFRPDFLQKQNEKPYQQKVLNFRNNEKTNRRRRTTDTNKPVYTNNIENALFTLSYMPLYVMNTMVENSTKRLVRKIQPLRILKNFFIEQDRITGKTIYGYQLEEDFRRNLSTYYLTTSTQSLINLRKSGLGPLYHHLLRLREALFAKGLTSTTPDDTPNFAYLCSLAKVGGNLEPKFLKSKLNAKLQKIFKETELDFEVEWISNGEKEKYTPLFHFNPAVGEVIGKDGYAVQAIKREEKLDVAVTELKIGLALACPYRSYEQMKNADKYFFEWLADDNDNLRKTLTAAIINTFINIAATTIPNDIEKRVDFLISCAKYKDKKDYDRWIQKTLLSDKFKFWEHFKKTEE